MLATVCAIATPHLGLTVSTVEVLTAVSRWIMPLETCIIDYLRQSCSQVCSIDIRSTGVTVLLDQDLATAPILRVETESNFSAVQGAVMSWRDNLIFRAIVQLRL